MSSNTTVLTATKVPGRSRRPKTVDELRVCADTGCDTQLSRYNRKGTCHVHSPIKFPRVRGRDVPVVDADA